MCYRSVFDFSSDVDREVCSFSDQELPDEDGSRLRRGEDGRPAAVRRRGEDGRPPAGRRPRSAALGQLYHSGGAGEGTGAWRRTNLERNWCRFGIMSTLWRTQN